MKEGSTAFHAQGIADWQWVRPTCSSPHKIHIISKNFHLQSFSGFLFQLLPKWYNHHLVPPGMQPPEPKLTCTNAPSLWSVCYLLLQWCLKWINCSLSFLCQLLTSYHFFFTVYAFLAIYSISWSYKVMYFSSGVNYLDISWTSRNTKSLQCIYFNDCIVLYIQAPLMMYLVM